MQAGWLRKCGQSAAMGRIFLSTDALMSIQPHVQWLAWAVPTRGQSGQSVNLIINFRVLSRLIMNITMCPVRGMSSYCVAFICSLDHCECRQLQFNFHPFSSLALRQRLSKFLPVSPTNNHCIIVFTQLSTVTEVCNSPKQAAHHYILLLKSGGFISDLVTWTSNPKKTSMRNC